MHGLAGLVDGEADVGAGDGGVLQSADNTPIGDRVGRGDRGWGRGGGVWGSCKLGQGHVGAREESGDVLGLG